MDDFLKQAIDNGDVRPVEEAFDEFNVEEEIHYGEACFYIAEENINYGKYNIGDIVFVRKFKYDNGLIGDPHLFVIINCNIAVSLDYFAMIISSNIEKASYDSNILLNKNKLKKDSIVKTDVMYKISGEQILYKIGVVDLKTIEKYKKNYINLKKLTKTSNVN